MATCSPTIEVRNQAWHTGRLWAWLPLAAWAMPVIVFLVVYAPVAGQGFISDDFRWILNSRLSSISEAGRLFTTNLEFYRPLVALTFAGNYALAADAPLTYGLTNLALALLAGALTMRLFEAVGVPRGAAGLGAAVWLLNAHGMSMAVLWISGRTSLLLTAASVGAMLAAVRGRAWLATGLVAMALFSKEEAVMLPAIMGAWLWLLPASTAEAPGSRRRALRLGAGLMVVLLAYLWLRTNAGAITFATAPEYYRLSVAPALLLRNVAEYADRAATVPIVVTLLALGILRPTWRLPPVRWRVMVCGLVWLVGGYAITVFLPVRSSLYACFPSVGACLIAAEVCGHRWQAAAPGRRRAALAVLVAVPVLLMPVYVQRNHRWTDLAAFSSRTLEQLSGPLARLPPGASILLEDDRATRVNLQSAFGTLLGDAIELAVGHRYDIAVEPPYSTGAYRLQCTECPHVRLSVGQQDEPRADAAAEALRSGSGEAERQARR